MNSERIMVKCEGNTRTLSLQYSMGSHQNIEDNLKPLCRQQQLRTVARFGQWRAGFQQDAAQIRRIAAAKSWSAHAPTALYMLLTQPVDYLPNSLSLNDWIVQIRQHSPLNTPQHLGAGPAPAAAEASTSTNTIDPGTSEERQIQVKTLLRELHRQYCAAKGAKLTAIQNLAEDVIKGALASGELTADEWGAAKMRFWIYPATVADMGSPTENVDDSGSPEDKIIELHADFFNAFEDDFDDRDLD